MTTPPFEAFGATAGPVRLAGGKGGTWRAGDLVLKPVEYLPETLWRAEVLDRLPESPAFRVARPVRATDGGWVADGWEATRFLPGSPDVARPDDVLRAGIAFHAAIARLDRPAFLDVRDDPWSDGDRVAWEEPPLHTPSRHAPPPHTPPPHTPPPHTPPPHTPPPHTPPPHTSPLATGLLRPLLEARRPVTLAAQAVHGDLAGNVLFAAGRPPAVIDWPLYWRPPSWASAVAVADALCWYGAGPDLARRWSHLPEWPQMLIRALIYRIVTHDRTSGLAGHADTYGPAIALTVRLSTE